MPKAPLGLLLLLLMLAASLAGCANFTAVSSGMPAQQVQAKLGAPETVRKNADGSEVWEYPGGPLGRQTYMVTLGSDHAVREVHQVLNDEYFSRVRAGMSNYHLTPCACQSKKSWFRTLPWTGLFGKSLHQSTLGSGTLILSTSVMAKTSAGLP